ncbi:MAG: hypothetical protein OIF32_12030 [Campylobacterales bacterium]|nr:hypothetical protein [Campylobacterales bacterium]
MNSTFTGLSIGALFTIYSPLEPSIFSIGGIALAVMMLIVAHFYNVLLQIKQFFYISLFVEVVMLFLVIGFIISPYTYQTALLVYIGYQLTFSFGSYLVRAETLFTKRRKLLTLIDSSKQLGYLIGMVASWLFYKTTGYYGVDEKSQAVLILHYFLFFVELGIIYFLLRSFKK